MALLPQFLNDAWAIKDEVSKAYPDLPKSATFNTLSIKVAKKPYIIGSLDPKALTCESFESKARDKK